MDRTVGGAGVDHVVVAVATTVTVLGFAVCRAAILRCTVHSVLLSDTRGGEPGRTCVHGAVVDGVLPVDCPGCEHGVSDS